MFNTIKGLIKKWKPVNHVLVLVKNIIVSGPLKVLIHKPIMTTLMIKTDSAEKRIMESYILNYIIFNVVEIYKHEMLFT